MSSTFEAPNQVNNPFGEREPIRMYGITQGGVHFNMTLNFAYFSFANDGSVNNVQRCYMPDQTRNCTVYGMIYGLDNDSFNVTSVQLRLRRNGSIVETYTHNFSTRQRNYVLTFANEHVFEPGDYADMEVRRNNSGADGNDSSVYLMYYVDV